MKFQNAGSKKILKTSWGKKSGHKKLGVRNGTQLLNFLVVVQKMPLALWKLQVIRRAQGLHTQKAFNCQTSWPTVPGRRGNFTIMSDPYYRQIRISVQRCPLRLLTLQNTPKLKSLLFIKWEPEIPLVLSLCSVVGLSKVSGFTQYQQDQKRTTGEEENLSVH